MCEKVGEARAGLDHLIDVNQSVTTEVESAFKAYAAVEEECRQAMLGHIYEVSSAMPAESRLRYVQTMKGHILLPHNMSRAAMHDPHSH